MASDTFEARGINSVIDSGNPKLRLMKASSGAADIKAGCVVTRIGETIDTSEVDLCAAVEEPYGVVIERYDTDIDTAFADNDIYLVVAPIAENRGNCILWLWCDGTLLNAQAEGEYLSGSIMTVTTAGQITKFNYVDAAEGTDTIMTKVGYLVDDVKDPAANEDRLARVAI